MAVTTSASFKLTQGLNVRTLSGAVGMILAALWLCGCVTSKVDTHSGTVDFTIISPGKIEYHFADKTIQTETFPFESDIKLQAGHFSHPEAGFTKEAELGWDCFGMTLRPMIQLRAFYLWSFGLSVGADENAFITGPDFRYKDILIGFLIGVPWKDPSKNIYGGKIAVPVNF